MRSPDLAIACGAAVAGLLISIADPENWLQAAVLTPLVLVVPGYAIAAALFPPGGIRHLDRIIYTFAFSISASALGGLALQLVLELDRAAWLGLLVVITVAASAVAGARRATLPIQRRDPAASIRLPTSPAWAIALLALAITAGAIAIAIEGVHEQQSRQHFASLWALPGHSEAGATWVETGIWNHGGPANYRLEISGDGQTIYSRQLRLAPHQRWSAKLRPTVPAGTDVLVVALKHRSSTYRELELGIAGAG
jgi:hypothetical protein